MKLIFIVGLTATGKTSLALQLAEVVSQSDKFSGIDIISADSRQVYQGLKIVSGADVPTKLNKKISLHGVNIIKPQDEWSVAHFIQLASEIIERAKVENRLVIIVGGTGLYQQKLLEALTDKKPTTLGVEPDYELRAVLEQLEVGELQEKLKQLNPAKWERMSRSDRLNPRRLVRAIEIATTVTPAQAGVYGLKKQAGLDSGSEAGMTFSNIIIGLTDSLENLQTNIRQRVEQRFHSGALEEVKQLLAKNLNPSLPALSATGVKELAAYLRGELTETECLDAWTLREFQYAKRQLTWWKKRKSVEWLVTSESDWLIDATKLGQNFLEIE